MSDIAKVDVHAQWDAKVRQRMQDTGCNRHEAAAWAGRRFPNLRDAYSRAEGERRQAVIDARMGK